ncbi:MAG TPA: alpha/beta hydrolase [Dehalococcoidia bacterium]|nr:alpha/beta hydrolase [Dehalococcoidia bacterium]
MVFARVNGIDIWYERSDGVRATLVLTHGFAGPTQGWPPIIGEFRRRYDLVLYDVRAHGSTAVPDDAATVSVPQFAADLAGLMTHLGIDRAHIGGVSMGGMISAQFACDFPDRVRSLLLCDTTAGNQAGPDAAANEVERALETTFERLAHIAEHYGMEELVERENRYHHEGDPYARFAAQGIEGLDRANRRNKIDLMTRAGYLQANRALRNRPDLTARTPSLGMPVLISCGEWDAFYACARRDHALIPNSRMVTIRGAAHATPDYQPELWLRAVSDFIDDVEAGRDIRGDCELAPDGEA